MKKEHYTLKQRFTKFYYILLSKKLNC